MKIGWIYRTEGPPPYLILKIRGKEVTFPDNKDGAERLAATISEAIGHDKWYLEDMQFLGYRIVEKE